MASVTHIHFCVVIEGLHILNGYPFYSLFSLLGISLIGTKLSCCPFPQSLRSLELSKSAFLLKYLHWRCKIAGLRSHKSLERGDTSQMSINSGSSSTKHPSLSTAPSHFNFPTLGFGHFTAAHMWGIACFTFTCNVPSVPQFYVHFPLVLNKQKFFIEWIESLKWNGHWICNKKKQEQKQKLC